jgi:hypothetical protein
MGEVVRWSDDADDMIKGDVTAAAAYLTPRAARWSRPSHRAALAAIIRQRIKSGPVQMNERPLRAT